MNVKLDTGAAPGRRSTRRFARPARRAAAIAAFAVLPALAAPAAALAGGGDAAAGEAKAASLCVACHGRKGVSTNPLWPNLAGQHAFYLAKQLREFRSGKRKDPVMNPLSGALSDEDIEDLAAYYESLKPE